LVTAFVREQNRRSDQTEGEEPRGSAPQGGQRRRLPPPKSKRGCICKATGELRRFANVYINDDDVRFLGGLGAPVLRQSIEGQGADLEHCIECVKAWRGYVQFAATADDSACQGIQLDAVTTLEVELH